MIKTRFCKLKQPVWGKHNANCEVIRVDQSLEVTSGLRPKGWPGVSKSIQGEYSKEAPGKVWEGENLAFLKCDFSQALFLQIVPVSLEFNRLETFFQDSIPLLGMFIWVLLNFQISAHLFPSVVDWWCLWSWLFPLWTLCSAYAGLDSRLMQVVFFGQWNVGRYSASNSLKSIYTLRPVVMLILAPQPPL